MLRIHTVKCFVIFNFNDFVAIYCLGDMDEDETISRHLPSFRPHHHSTEEDPMAEDDVEAISQAKLYSDHHHHHHYHPHQHHQTADR